MTLGIGNLDDACVSGRDFIHRRGSPAGAVSWRSISAHQEVSNVLNFLVRHHNLLEISICNAPSYAFLLAALW